ncbi:MAG: 2-nitropropane dioxygenase [Chloroflexi bacterium RBG_13_51_18]|nr:MAG: 2-nitropropane dioxygenase [Chloroflexi bacterium RBG_13_51_18]
MSPKKIPKLRIGDLEVDIPIIQGGMGVGVSLSGLASAIANEGGIGVISAAGIGMLEADFERNFKEANRRVLRREIIRAKEMTKGIIGVNILVALSDYDELVKTAVAEGADLVFLGAGLPLKVPGIWPLDEWEKVTTKIVPIVSSSRAAKIIFQSWQKNYNCVPDAVVVEGPLAGGHLGFKKEQINDPAYTLEKIFPEVISVIKPFEQFSGKKIPVIAAGGVYTGADIYKFIRLGASGVQMATRFVATYECDASVEFKDAYIKCNKEDLVIIDSPVGLPGRAIRNRFLEEIESGNKMPFKCPWKCLKTCDLKSSPYCIAKALTNAKNGHLEQGFAFAGANAYKIDKIISVKELLKTLLMEYEKAS